MANLFDFLNHNKDLTWLLKACIFHYELEFIHPLSDGNGRMGRLWQQMVLMKEDNIFTFIPVEELIRDNQETYYHVLGICDQAVESTKFIEFSLQQILGALITHQSNALFNIKDTTARLNYAFLKIEQEWFSSKDYMMVHKHISSATASRDLEIGLKDNLLNCKGEKNQTRYKALKPNELTDFNH